MALFKVFLLVLALVSMALLGLATRIVFKKDGKFPNIHIGANKHLKKEGITCAQTYDKVEQAKANKKLSIKELRLVEESSKGNC